MYSTQTSIYCQLYKVLKSYRLSRFVPLSPYLSRLAAQVKFVPGYKSYYYIFGAFKLFEMLQIDGDGSVQINIILEIEGIRVFFTKLFRE